MADSSPISLTHRLILPADSNHHGTLYAGSLLRIALEAGYSTAWRHIGPEANLVLRRVINLECLKPVPVGSVIEIRGVVLHHARAYVVTGLVGMPIKPDEGPWLEALLGFAHVNEEGRPASIPGLKSDDVADLRIPATDPWPRLEARLKKLLRVR